MYVVTFYSFKGGVGRTMALVNCAFELAQRGRRVLLVDFDLEAPGIPTFEGFSDAKNMPGIVDYVTDYLKSGAAPHVRDYIYDYKIDDIGNGRLWLLSAGNQSADYSAKYQSIDWNSLYEKNDGYLLFEDMKAQWQQELNPDYVFIDSRTGHTDLGGICTRQLPDAVCLMFFPNDQNLSGLPSIANEIRAEARTAREKNICLHFVPSNVPSLDDELQILPKRLGSFEEQLQYSSPTSIIHHYDSWLMLEQKIFTKHNKNTKLAKEYASLVDKVISSNLSDRDAAIGALNEIQNFWTKPNIDRSSSLADMQSKLEIIAQSHTNDGEILYRLGIANARMGNSIDAEFLLTRAIELGFDAPPVYMQRALNRRTMKEDALATDDIKKVLADRRVSERDFLFATRWLVELNPQFSDEVVGSTALREFPATTKIQIATELMSSRRSLNGALRLINGVIADSKTTEKEMENALNKQILCFIGLQRYDDALNITHAPQNSLIDSFNYAMADWAKNGKPSSKHFSIVRDLFTSQAIDVPDPNRHQCFALTYAVLGQRNASEREYALAKDSLIRSSRKCFSCWSYLEVAPLEFLKDLEAIKIFAATKEGCPSFMVLSTEEAPQLSL